MFMEAALKALDSAAYEELLSTAETHFIELKSIEIAPAKLTKPISAFANTGGGEIFVGIEEIVGLEGP